MRQLAILVLAVVAAAAATACKASGTFTCETADQCGPAIGAVCEASGFCAFPDASCTDGLRYDEYAGGGFASVCVGAALDDGGTLDSRSAGDGPRPIDAAACAQWTAHAFDPCRVPAPGPALELFSSLSPYTYDTTSGGGVLTDNSGATIAVTSGQFTQTDGTLAAAISVDGFTVEQAVTLAVIGTKPLVIAAWGSITTAGTIDAGSHAAGHAGAGENPGVCAGGGAGTGTDGASGTGGGGGGAFSGSGGHGGAADANCTPGPACEKAGGLPGTAVSVPMAPRGGCEGARSGLSGTTFAQGGAGGGAIVLAARDVITISGLVLAGGAGGAADTSATLSTGGGGGGAGGYIGLDSPMINLTATAFLAANGGAGGGGGDVANTGSAGADGGQGTAGAVGGTPGGQATGGGTGSTQSTLAGASVSGVQSGGGGGGGGGAGYILYWSGPINTSVASPPIQQGP